MRVALHSTLRPGSIDGYRTAHTRIPDELAAAFQRVGIHDWTIWRSGDRLFHLVDCDDFDAAMRALEQDPANVRWQDVIGRHVEVFRGADGEKAFRPLEEMWDLASQRAAD